MSSDSKATFLKHSSWLVIATTLSGAFLASVYSVVALMKDDAEIGIFMSMLRLFTLLSIPAAGLQVVMAQEAAAAITPEQQRQLAVTSRSVLRGIFLVWCVILIVCILFRPQILASLKITDRVLWITLGLVLGALCLPIVQGLLQGLQKFPWLAASIFLNGAGRFFGILVVVLVFHAKSPGALLGALFGVASAVLIGLWPSRALFKPAPGKFAWGTWLKRLLPLTAGSGAIVFVMQADVVFVKKHFTSEISLYYSSVALLGVALVAFTAPMAAVMFPKLVNSLARSEKSNSLALALTGTFILASVGALICTIFPSLPLRIIYFNKPNLWESAQLVPWFMWAMLPVTVANVLISNLLARQRFAAVPFLVLVAIAFGFSLESYLSSASSLPHFVAFKGVVLRLGIFSALLLLISVVFTLLPTRKTVAQ